jgi:hypothetical protein
MNCRALLIQLFTMLKNQKPIGHKTIIEINTEHDFYLEFMKPLFDENDLNKIDDSLLNRRGRIKNVLEIKNEIQQNL